MLRPWAKWCITHNLRIVVQIVWLLSAPLYLLAYFGDAIGDWKADGTAIAKATGENHAE